MKSMDERAASVASRDCPPSFLRRQEAFFNGAERWSSSVLDLQTAKSLDPCLRRDDDGVSGNEAGSKNHVRGTLALACICAMTIGLLPACKRNDPQAEAAAVAAQAAATEDAARQSAAALDDAVSKQNWPLAKAQADVLLAQYPDSEAAKRVRAQFDEVKAKADAMREQTRMASLWSYNSETVKGGQQLSASIYAKEDIDTDGTGPRQVRLIFRDHPSWGKSAYLVLQAGDFDCYGGCRVPVTLDDQAAKTLPASRPKTDEAIAMFIDDQRALWRMTKDAKVMRIEFPTKAVGKKTAMFEVGGLDRTKLPGWD